MNQENVLEQEFMARLRDVEMDVTVRFGLTELPLREVAALGSGSMLELNRTVDEPVELLVNDCPFARGEVVVVDGYYSVRITEVSPAERHSNTFLVDGVGSLNSEPFANKAEQSAPNESPTPTQIPPAAQAQKPSPPQNQPQQAPQQPPQQAQPKPAAPPPPAAPQPKPAAPTSPENEQ